MNVIGGMIELGFPCLEYFGKPEFILKGVVIPGDWGLIKRTWSLSLSFFFFNISIVLVFMVASLLPFS
jgi:hypothetical protein